VVASVQIHFVAFIVGVVLLFEGISRSTTAVFFFLMWAMLCFGGEIANANLEDAGSFFLYIESTPGWIANIWSCFFVASD